MNPELRAKLEGLDVWHLALASKKGTKQTTEEERRQAWQAYYDCEKAQKREEALSSMHVPQMFRQFAAENGVLPSDAAAPAPPKLEGRKLRTLADADRDSETQLTKIADLKVAVAERDYRLKGLEAEVAGLKGREAELSGKIGELEEDVQQLRNNCASLTEEKANLTVLLEEATTNTAALEQQQTAAQGEMAHLRDSTAEGVVAQELRAALTAATERAESAEAALKALRTENDAILSKMRHAKQQFDKLRKQSHERNVENDALKEEVARLQERPAIQSEETATLQEQLTVLQGEKSRAEEGVRSIQDQMDHLAVLLSEKEAEVERCMADGAAWKTSCGSLQRTVEEREADLQSVRGLLEQCQQELELKDAEVTAQLAQAREKEAEIEVALKMKTGEIEDLSEMLDQREQEMEVLQRFEQEAISLQNQLDAKGGALEELRAQLNALQAALTQAEEGKATLEESGLQQRELLEKREEELTELKGQFHEFMTQIDTLTDTLAARDQEIERKSHELREKDAEIEQFRAQAQAELQEKDARIEQFQAQVQTELQEKDAEVERLSVKVQECLIQKDEMDGHLESLVEATASKDGIVMELNKKLEQLTADAAADASSKNAAIEELSQTLEQLTADAAADASSKNAAIEELNQKLAQISADYGQNAQSWTDEKSQLLAELEAARASVEDSQVLKERLSELEAHLSDVTAKEREASQKIAEMDASLAEALEIAEIADRESQQAAEEKATMQQAWQAAQAELQELQSSVTSKTADASKLQSLLSRRDVEMESLRTRFQTVEAQLLDVTAELETVRHERSVAQRHLTEATEKTSELSRLKADLAAAAEAQSERDQLGRGLRQAQERLAGTQSRLETCQSQKQELESQLETGKAYQYELLEEIQSLKGSMHQAAREELGAVRHQLEEAELAKQNLQKELKGLQTQTTEIPALRQKVMRLETALAVAGQTQPAPKSPATQAQIQALEQRATRAEAQKGALYTEVESLRVALEEARRQVQMRPGPSEAPQTLGGMSNKKDEDRGYDIEAAVLSGGDPSGFQPLSGLLRGLLGMAYLGLCIKASDFVDRGFILLMRYPALRYVLLVYFTLLHFVAFV